MDNRSCEYYWLAIRLFDRATRVALQFPPSADALLELSESDLATSVEGLWLEDTVVFDAAIQHFSAFINLQELHLDGTKITDGGLRHLSELARLHTLSLSRTRVTKDGVDAICRELPECEVTY